MPRRQAPRPLQPDDLWRRGATCSGCAGATPPERLAEAMAAWGWCGLLQLAESDPVLVVLVPEPAEPGTARLLALHPVGSSRGEQRARRRLVEAMALRLDEVGVQRVRSRGHRWSGDCARPPQNVLVGHGFAVVVPHPVHPELELELRGSLARTPESRWTRSALGRLLSHPGAFRPVVPTAPVLPTARSTGTRQGPGTALSGDEHGTGASAAAAAAFSSVNHES